MKISEIKLNKKNPRLIKGDKFEKLKKSITEFPKMLELRPIIIDDQNIILGGNMRYQALKDLGYKELPDNWVKKSSELSEEEKQRFIIADNVGFGDWDWDIIANEWDTEILADWGLDVPSFEALEPEAGGNFDDAGIGGTNSYGVIVICESEGNQESVFKDLSSMGYNCKVVVV